MEVAYFEKSEARITRDLDPIGLPLQRSALAATGRRPGPAGACSPSVPNRSLALRLESSRSPGGAAFGEAGNGRDGGDLVEGGETVGIGLPTLLELRLSLSRLAALHDAERWEETSEALAALGRKLGRLLPVAARGSGPGREADYVHLDLRGQALMALPWELATGLNGRPLFAPGSGALIRSEAGLRSPTVEPGIGPLTVTLLAEEPIHFGLSDLSASVAAIRETLGRARPDSPGTEISFVLGNLNLEPPPSRPARVLHLLGHGYETSGLDARFEYGMHCASLRDAIPEDAYGEAPAGPIAEALARHAPVEALLLDACYTGGGFRWDGTRWRDPLCTHAARLGCSVAVSFFDAMKITKARDFASSFYDGLLAGEAPLAAAVAAREALFLSEMGRPLADCAWWRVRIGSGPA